MLNIEQLSFWERITYFEQLDFLIVGGGIVGSSTALHLKKKYPDAKILILERSYLPNGASTKNAGFACFGSPTELLSDLKSTDASGVWSTVQERWEGLQQLRKLIGDEYLDYQQNGSWDLISERHIDTRSASLHELDDRPMTERDDCSEEVRGKLDYLNSEVEKITGNAQVYSENKNCVTKFGFNGISTAFHNKLEGQIHTGKMMQRYHQLLHQMGIFVLGGITAKSIHDNGQLVHTSIGEIKTKDTVICTNGFAQQLIDTATQPARAQVMVTSPIPDLKIKGTFHMDEGFYYFRNFENRILFGGGRNVNPKGETSTEMTVTNEIQHRLEELLQKNILPNSSYTIDYRWAGIMGIGSTKKPFIKQLDKHLTVGVKLGGMGVAIGTNVGRRIVSEL